MTTRAMLAFRCIAERCEDSCCRGWAIELGVDDVERLVQLGRKSPELRDCFQRGPAGSEDAYATMKQDAAGACAMLDGVGRCRIHAEHGEFALPLVCSMHPRSLRRSPAGRHEMIGSTSCPEYTRRLLLDADGAECTAFDPQQCPRPLPSALVGDGQRSPYIDTYDELRDAMRHVYQRSQQSLRRCLVNLAELATRLRVVAHAESDRDPRPTIARALKRLDPSAPARATVALDARGREFSLRFVFGLGGGARGRGRLQGLFREVQASVPELDHTPEEPVLSKLLIECELGLSPGQRQRLEQLCLRLVSQLLFAGSHVRHIDVGDCIRRLLIEVMGIRALVLVLVRQRGLPADDGGAFDALVVEVVSAWSRALQLNNSFSTAVRDFCSVLQLSTPTGTSALADWAAAFEVHSAANTEPPARTSAHR